MGEHLKQLAPVRLIRNKFRDDVMAAESQGATVQQLQELLGKGRAKRGIFEGDLEEGELEIGQIGAALRSIEPAGAIVQQMWAEYQEVRAGLAR